MSGIKHKRKWILLLIIFISLLLMPLMIGQLLRSQLSKGFATGPTSAPTTSSWHSGWLQSQWQTGLAVADDTATLNLNIDHGPLWLQPAGAGLARWQGTLSLENFPALPVTGHLSLIGHYWLNLNLPADFSVGPASIQSPGPATDTAGSRITGSLGSQAIHIGVTHPAGSFTGSDGRLNWLGFDSTLQLHDAAAASSDGHAELRTQQLRWQGLAGPIEFQLDDAAIELSWPADGPIHLQADIRQLWLPGQNQPSGTLSLQAKAVSIDRTALQYWFSHRGQSAGQEMNANQLLAIASLLAAQPEFILEKLQLQTPAGLINLKAVLQLHPGRREARISGDMPATAAEWLAVALTADTEAGQARLQELISDGWIRRSGDQLIIDVIANL